MLVIPWLSIFEIHAVHNMGATSMLPSNVHHDALPVLNVTGTFPSPYHWPTTTSSHQLPPSSYHNWRPNISFLLYSRHQLHCNQLIARNEQYTSTTCHWMDSHTPSSMQTSVQHSVERKHHQKRPTSAPAMAQLLPNDKGYGEPTQQ